jgi:hypothetical protein
MIKNIKKQNKTIKRNFVQIKKDYRKIELLEEDTEDLLYDYCKLLNKKYSNLLFCYDEDNDDPELYFLNVEGTSTIPEEALEDIQSVSNASKVERIDDKHLKVIYHLHIWD